MKRMAGMLILLTSLGGCGLFHKEHPARPVYAAQDTHPLASKDLSRKELVLTPGEAKKMSDAGDKKPAGALHKLPEPKSPSSLPERLPTSSRGPTSVAPAAVVGTAAVPVSTGAPAVAPAALAKAAAVPPPAPPPAAPAPVAPPPTTAALAGSPGSAIIPGPAPMEAAALPSPPLPAVKPAPLPPLPPLSEPANQALRPVDYKEAKVLEEPPSCPQPLALDPAKASAGTPTVRVINSRHIVLDFALRDGAATPMVGVELWYTRDAQTWVKHPRGLQRSSPMGVDIAEEGTYGFTLVPCSESGPITRRPQSGDLPQAWVVVDLTAPKVTLTSAEIRDHKLTILWRATDANLGARPITLSYAVNDAGPWTPIAANLPNSGCHLWTLPDSLPPRILVRVEAADEVGNIGTAQTPQPLVVQPAPSAAANSVSKPRVAILTIEPVEEK